MTSISTGRLPQDETLLVACGITKSYEGQRALDEVDFTLRPGEIHGLLGENGAGKSTLMGVLSGVVRPDRGSITVAGGPLRLGSPADSAALGIGMVHQHFSLIPALTVAENLSLAAGAGPALYRRAAGLAGKGLSLAWRFGWEFEPDTPVWQLSIGRQQRLEILKALQRGARWLLFDEPTAVLSPPEVEELFQFLDHLREEGRAIVFISHKLPEVTRLCDRVTVLRRGRIAGELPRGASMAALARLMIGSAEGSPTDPGFPWDTSGETVRDQSTPRDETAAYKEGEVGAGASGSAAARSSAPGPAALSVSDLHVRDDRGVETVRGRGRGRERPGGAG
jgi:general nucleoside transport system ATP-binding protein